MSGPDMVQVKRLGTAASFLARLRELGLELPFEPDPVADPDPLARPLALGSAGVAANRFCVLPMEGWDGTGDGRPTDLVRRRWRRFGRSRAGTVWGGEAVAVVPEARANPRQLCIGAHSVGDLAELRSQVIEGHAETRPEDPPPVVGLQLTHSGRWSRPDGAPAPRTAWSHRLLDRRVGAGAVSVLSDDELDDLIGAFVAAAAVAAEAGFDFVDVKACHGYLVHELLGAVQRPGPYGGDLAGRSRFVRRVIEGIRGEVPDLAIGSRLSLFDVVAHRPGADRVGEPEARGDDVGFCFGGDGTGIGVDLTETHQLIEAMRSWGVEMVCATAASPYYAPHAQRPAWFPPSDGYRPPRDPLVDTVALLTATAEVSRVHHGLPVIASGLTYLQDWLPAVARGLVDERWCAAAGVGRMVLSYPELPADVLAGRALRRRSVCRTFSDCTTAPRHGLVSGCYPLDPHYKEMPERVELAAVKRRLRTGGDVGGDDAEPDEGTGSDGDPGGPR